MLPHIHFAHVFVALEDIVKFLQHFHDSMLCAESTHTRLQYFLTQTVILIQKCKIEDDDRPISILLKTEAKKDIIKRFPSQLKWDHWIAIH